MIRELAGRRYDRVRTVLDWPLAEGLITYVARCRKRALAQYRFDVLAWLLALHPGVTPGPAPELPPLLAPDPDSVL